MPIYRGSENVGSGVQYFTPEDLTSAVNSADASAVAAALSEAQAAVDAANAATEAANAATSAANAATTAASIAADAAAAAAAATSSASNALATSLDAADVAAALAQCNADVVLCDADAAATAADAASTAADVATMAGYFPLVSPPVENNAILQDAAGGIKDAGTGLTLVTRHTTGQLAMTLPGGTITGTHTMGAVPDVVQIWLDCITNDNSYTGYQAGESVMYKSGGAFNNDNTNHHPGGMQVMFTSTAMVVQFSSQNETLSMLQKGTGYETSINSNNAANWRLRIVAFVFGQVIP